MPLVGSELGIRKTTIGRSRPLAEGPVLMLIWGPKLGKVLYIHVRILWVRYQ
jgi:hypothetical protein